MPCGGAGARQTRSKGRAAPRAPPNRTAVPQLHRGASAARYAPTHLSAVIPVSRAPARRPARVAWAPAHGAKCIIKRAPRSQRAHLRRSTSVWRQGAASSPPSARAPGPLSCLGWRARSPPNRLEQVVVGPRDVAIRRVAMRDRALLRFKVRGVGAAQRLDRKRRVRAVALGTRRVIDVFG